MASSIRVGSRVKWRWGNSWAYGKVKESFRKKVTRTIKDNKVTREASKDELAYLIAQEDGDRVLKSHSEVRSAS